MNASSFAKELYKLIRNKVKKLDDIQKIEDRIKEVGAKAAILTEEQTEKLQNKENYMQSVQQTIEAFEIYKQTELAAMMSKQEVTKEAPKVTEEVKEETKAATPSATEH